MQFDDQFSGNIDLAWGLVGCGLVVEGGWGDGADMTLPNHSRRPAKMKEQVVQDDQRGFQKKRLCEKFERCQRWSNFIWHSTVGRGVGS